MANAGDSYKDFLEQRGTSPEMVHLLLLSADLWEYIRQAYADAPEVGRTVEGFFRGKLAPIREKVKFPEEDEDITVGRMLTIARLLTKDHGKLGKKLHDQIVYLLLVLPYSKLYPDLAGQEIKKHEYNANEIETFILGYRPGSENK